VENLRPVGTEGGKGATPLQARNAVELCIGLSGLGPEPEASSARMPIYLAKVSLPMMFALRPTGAIDDVSDQTVFNPSMYLKSFLFRVYKGRSFAMAVAAIKPSGKVKLWLNEYAAIKSVNT